MRKKYISGLLGVALWISLVPIAFATPIAVQVTVPTFDVTLNGVIVENSYRQYPLLLYKGITYFPMTYDDCRFLGLSTDWSSSKGLSINKTTVSSYALERTLNPARNNNSYRVSITQFPITLNGTSIDNMQETYPLLQFQDITYFPLTWRFAVDQFGWSYNFGMQKGLNIASYVLPDTSYQQGTTVTRKFDDIIVHIRYSGRSPSTNNLTIERKGTATSLGDPKYTYGYTVVASKDENGIDSYAWQINSEMTLLDGWLYTAATPSKSFISKQCKINIITNETILLGK